MATKKGFCPPPAEPSSPSSLEHKKQVSKDEHVWEIPPETREWLSYQRPEFRAEPASAVESRFRHSGWQHRRRELMIAMARCHTSVNRLDRFCECGSNSWLQRSPSTGQTRLVSNCCHDRWCVPCGHARQARLRRRLADLLAGGRCRFITLTLRHSPGTLSQQLDRLIECYRRLRQRRLWQDKVDGAAAVIEVKESSKGLWHVHVHILAVGKFIDQAVLSNEWLSVTGDSSIVDIRLIHDSNKAIAYVVKYVGKAVSLNDVSTADRLEEAIVAFKGRRLVIATGTFHGRGLAEDESDDPGDWENWIRLDRLLLALSREEPWAVALVPASPRLERWRSAPGPGP